MSSNKNTTVRPYQLIIIFVLLVSVIILYGTKFYNKQREYAKQDQFDKLRVAVDLKANEITHWANERIFDINIVTLNKSFISGSAQWFEDNENTALKNNIVDRLDLMINYGNYKSIYLLDKKGNIKISIRDTIRKLEPAAIELFKNSLAQKKPVFSTIYLCNKCNNLHLDIVSPMYKSNELMGALLFRVDPNKFFYPIIKEGILHLESSECILVEKEGNDIIYLNQPKLSKDISFGYRIKQDSTETKNPPILSFLDKNETAEGMDYRKADVLAGIKKIQDFPWYLIVKIDTEEALGLIRGKATYIALFFALLIAFTGILILWIWNNQKKSIQIHKIKSELQRQLLLKHFEYLFKYANDIIILSDNELNIIEINDHALRDYGYSKEEMLKLTIRDLITEDSEPRENTITPEEAENGIISETTHRRKDKSSFPVEESLRLIDVDGEKFYQRIIRDITERKKTQELILQERDFSNTSLNSLPGIFYLFDNNGKFLRINDNFLKITEYTREEIEDLYPLDFFDGEDKKLIEENIKKVFETGYTEIEAMLTSKSGKKTYFLFTGQSIFIDDKSCVIGMGIDITKRKLTEEELSLNHTLLTLISRAQSQVISEAEPGQIFENVLKDVLEITHSKYGFIAESLQTPDGNPYIKIYSITNISWDEKTKLLYEQYAKKGFEFHNLDNLFGEVINTMKPVISNDPSNDSRSGGIPDGHPQLNSFLGLPFISGGNIVGMIGIANKPGGYLEKDMEFLEPLLVTCANLIDSFRNNEKRKRAEDELRKLSQAIEQSSVSVIITDKNENIEYVNPKFTMVSGYSYKEALGKSPINLLSTDISNFLKNEINSAINSLGEWKGEFYNQKKGGEYYWDSITISSIRNQNNETTHMLYVSEDITEKKQKETELITAKEKAEESGRIKSNFLANMSHELRTPMVGILGFSEILKDSVEIPEVKDMAENIYAGAGRLMNTLNLILDLSRIEAGKVNIKYTTVNLVEISEKVYTLFKPKAEKENLELTFSSTQDAILVNADEQMVYQIISNLVNNGIKFTKKGSVSLRVDTKTINGSSKAIIEVEDTGIGISKEIIPTIFEEFRQASEGLNRSFEGTGLGLTITKNFIEKLNGSIEVKSEVEKGTLFTVTFPLEGTISYETPSEKPKEDEIQEVTILPAPGEKNILCVDDDAATQELLNIVLRKTFKVDFASNGELAFEKARDNKYSLIMMDINLGKGLDGVATAKKIRELPGYEKVPIAAMTAFAMKGDKEEFISAGMDDYISKPFTLKSLREFINKLIKSTD